MRLQLSHVLTPDPSDRDSRAGSCAPTALRLCLLQVLSVTRGGFSHLACFMEVQQMALQHARGQPGPAAVEMANTLLRTLPHEALVAR